MVIVAFMAAFAAVAMAAVGPKPNQTYQGTSKLGEYGVQVQTACSSYPKPCKVANQAGVDLGIAAKHCGTISTVELGAARITGGRFTLSGRLLEVQGAAFSVTGTFVSKKKVVGTVNSTDARCGGTDTYVAVLQRTP